MGQWVHQQSSTMYVNRGIKWWFIVCCPEKQTSKKHIWVGPIFVHSSHLLLCVDSKSSPGHTTMYNVTPIFPFSTKRPVGWPVCTTFTPLSFLFVPSPMYYILNSPTPTLFLVWTKYSLRPELLVIKMDVSRAKIHLDTSISMTSISGQREYQIRLHEVALPLTIEEKKGDVGLSDREGLRGRKWCTCSDVASWGSRARLVSKEDIPEGHRDVDRWAAGGGIRPH